MALMQPNCIAELGDDGSCSAMPACYNACTEGAFLIHSPAGKWKLSAYLPLHLPYLARPESNRP